MKSRVLISAMAAGAVAFTATPAMAKKDPPPELVKCEESLGTIALVEGDTTGWTEWDLGSPRNLVNALAVESGCFTPHNPANGAARFLVTVVAGSEEEVDQSISAAKSVATQALVSSGAAGSVVSKVPFGGAALGLFGGFGGKKKTYAAGIRVVSPANGLTLAAGSGTVKKNTLDFGGSGGWATNAASAAGYQNSKEGKRLTEAFVIAFNNLIAQRAAIETAPAAAGAAPATPGAVVAVDTVMHSGPAADASELRKLRAGTELTPTGNREGLFIEAEDGFGTKGWVSVEDLS